MNSASSHTPEGRDNSCPVCGDKCRTELSADSSCGSRTGDRPTAFCRNPWTKFRCRTFIESCYRMISSFRLMFWNCARDRWRLKTASCLSTAPHRPFCSLCTIRRTSRRSTCSALSSIEISGSCTSTRRFFSAWCYATTADFDRSGSPAASSRAAGTGTAHQVRDCVRSRLLSNRRLIHNHLRPSARPVIMLLIVNRLPRHDVQWKYCRDTSSVSSDNGRTFPT